jgi:hypothetical protein
LTVAAGAPPRRRRARRILAAIALVLLALAAVLAVVLSRGVRQLYPRDALQTPAQQVRAPAWTQPCRRIARQTTKPACVHVSGRVIWIQEHDPDGDGDRHVIVMSRLRPRIVKLPQTLPLAHLPRIGAWIDAVGWLAFGASGHTEVDTERYVSGDATAQRG